MKSMTTSDPIPRRTRHVKRWGVAAAASVSVCGLWFAYLNWDGCWFFLRGTRGLITFVPFCVWLLLFFGFRVMGSRSTGTWRGLSFSPADGILPFVD
jgi:hypothetical protein